MLGTIAMVPAFVVALLDQRHLVCVLDREAVRG